MNCTEKKMETCFIQLVPIVYERFLHQKYFKLEGNMHFVENTDVYPDVKTGLDAVLRQPYFGASAELYAMGKKSHGEVLIQNLSVHAYDNCTMVPLLCIKQLRTERSDHCPALNFI